MKYTVVTKVRRQEFYDKDKAETYFNACARVGVDARLIEEDILGRQKTLAVA